jgi:hypothetical protein
MERASVQTPKGLQKKGRPEGRVRPAGWAQGLSVIIGSFDLTEVADDDRQCDQTPRHRGRGDAEAFVDKSRTTKPNKQLTPWWR